MKKTLKKGRGLIAESRNEITGAIVGGLTVAILIVAAPKLIDALAGVSINIPLIALPITLGVMFAALLLFRAIHWARAIGSRLRVLEAEAAAHADSLELLEQTTSLPDAIRAAEARGWKVEVTKNDHGVHHEMVRAYGDSPGEMRIGGGIDFSGDETDERRPEDNEQLLAAMILSTARRHVDLPSSAGIQNDTELDQTVRALPRRNG